MKKLTHKKLDAKWSRLPLELKRYALEKATMMKEAWDRATELRKRVEEARRGKDPSKECTCLPEVKGSCYIDDHCSYCQARFREDYYNSPG